ncbi:hypothetical protein jhhlp_000215 [Lomentospora prolificans]|uniref:Molybdate-anion transporter n=1 Tax=Lomentospora prolificans TaxID=41688 RepID=A0A2N3NK94_9PEZI|nr:hypothetical protein jhhlp_000215 [Lomentospora prolificans]
MFEDLYQKNLAGLLLICGTLLATRSSHRQKPTTQATEPASKDAAQPASQLPFYTVYALVMASDWLQGPYLYSLYRDEHAVSPPLIPLLFTTGFLSGALSAYFVGSVADRRGRRAACLAFCAVYALSCLLTMVPSVPLLFAGRVLGGVGTSLLFSAFDAWMVADFQRRGLRESGLELATTFGTMSTVNSVVAVVSGVVSEWVVEGMGTRRAPFGVAVGVLVVAAGCILRQWDENYGETPSPSSKSQNAQNQLLLKALTNKRVLSLGLASTMFEGSMYLFVFFWAPALESSAYASSSTAPPLPYGTIFASFMASMMAASLLFTKLSSSSSSTSSVNHGALLSALLAVSAAIFYALSSAPRGEQAAFWLFCAFEACVGVYWPCVGVLKGRVVDDAVRGQVYGVLRVPLNVFVVASLAVTSGGGDYVRVFRACAAFLMVGAGAVGVVVARQ